ncbi:hypothetical protein MKSMC1_56480 [Mycobacterium kansasii]|nr:hypothetical protein MKSMC1_56480 [Mycobacterium kansasii]
MGLLSRGTKAVWSHVLAVTMHTRSIDIAGRQDHRMLPHDD